MSDDDNAKVFADQFIKQTGDAELTRLRAELAAEREAHKETWNDVERLSDRLTMREEELAAERELGAVINRAFCEIAEELGVEPDNEQILIAIDGLKSEHNYLKTQRNAALANAAELREALVKSRSAMEPYNSDIYPPIQGACASADAVLSETKGDGDE